LTDGILLCKLINLAHPETIDDRVINIKKLNIFRMKENANLVFSSCKSIGVVVVNSHPDFILEGNKSIILGLVWQLIKI